MPLEQPNDHYKKTTVPNSDYLHGQFYLPAVCEAIAHDFFRASKTVTLKAAIHVVIYDLVTSYGIESSSILYDTLYATYDHAIL